MSDKKQSETEHKVWLMIKRWWLPIAILLIKEHWLRIFILFPFGVLVIIASLVICLLYLSPEQRATNNHIWLQLYLGALAAIGGVILCIPRVITSSSEKYFITRVLTTGITGGAFALLLPIAVKSTTTGVGGLRHSILLATGGLLAILTLGETRRKNDNDLKAANELQIRHKETLDQQKFQFKEQLEEQQKQFNASAFKERKAERRERYTKAVEQLGSKEASVRMGGVYTLVGLVDEWLEEESIEKYEDRLKEGQVIINNLCAYIRSPFTLASRYDELLQDTPTTEVIYKNDQQKSHKKWRIISNNLYACIRSRFTPDSRHDELSQDSYTALYKDREQEFYADKATLESEADVRLSIIKEIHDRLQGPEENTPGTWSDFEYDFSGSIFFYPVEFTKSYYKKPVNFSGSHYYKKVNFSGSTYEKDATFSTFNFRSTYQGWADFTRSTYQDEAHFNSSTYQDEAHFNNSTYQEKAYFNNSTYKRANFTGSTYQGWANFIDSTYQSADFSGSTYQKEAYFNNSTYQRAAFRNSTYHGQANFSGSTYQSANFSGSIYRSADFSSSTYENRADFSGSTYKWSYFSSSTYKWSYFSNSIYQEGVYFSDSTYQSADFSGSIFYQEIYFGKDGSNNSSSCFTNCTLQFYDKKKRKNTLFGSRNNDFTVDAKEGYSININSEGLPLDCKFLTSDQKEQLADNFQEIEKIQNELLEAKDSKEKAKISIKLRTFNEKLHEWRKEATTVKAEDAAADTES